MKVVFHRLVQRDIDEASQWYEDQSPGLSDEFYDDFLETIEKIRNHPTAFSLELSSGRRFANLKRFPYKIVFRTIGDGLVKVFVVKHQKRRPGFGNRRN